ncbi:hypothetical protein E8E15_003126 [Penicillium rubens]|nr:hypothetical protein E8E15_003126 [Penicillium rubens]
MRNDANHIIRALVSYVFIVPIIEVQIRTPRIGGELGFRFPASPVPRGLLNSAEDKGYAFASSSSAEEYNVWIAYTRIMFWPWHFVRLGSDEKDHRRRLLDHHLRLYVIETLALFVGDRILRRVDTITESVTVTQIPATDLLKVQIHIPASKVSRFQAKPGQHVYMCVSTGSGCSGANRLLSNPFTVANVSVGEVTLLLRTRRGPTTQMLLTHADRFNALPVIDIEGPYGTSVDIADVTGKFDRILLVAGGIGATFVLPVYRALREHFDGEVGGHKRLNFTWALRSAAEVAWAAELEDQVFADNPNVQIYLTGHGSLEHSFRNSFFDGMEMGELQTSDGLVGGSKAHMGRPNLREIVDQTFSYHGEESVAVFFCGPHDMGRELRAHVGRWVAKGRSVFWRQEIFGS